MGNVCPPNNSIDSFTYNFSGVGMDTINPPHYQRGAVECIDAIRASMTDLEFRGFLKGNVIKYVWRYDQKGGAESLAKAMWYLELLHSLIEEKENTNAE
jgi:hypothetical protein